MSSPVSLRVLRSIDQFEAVKTDWETAHRADPHASVFMSWAWLRAYYGTFAPESLFILALRADGADADVAFFPLQLDEPRPGRRFVQYRDLLAGGSGGTSPANYTGIVCRPEYEAEALTKFGAYLRLNAAWERLLMRDVQDPRVERMMTGFSSRRFDVQVEEGLELRTNGNGDLEAHFDAMFNLYRARIDDSGSPDEVGHRAGEREGRLPPRRREVQVQLCHRRTTQYQHPRAA